MALPVTVESVVSAARDAAIASMHQLLRDRLSTATPVREQHGKDASYHPCVPPDAVAFAQSTAEVSEIVKICARHKVPIIPFGSGTGLEGHVVALRGGVCIDISRMNQILEVRVGDLDATVQAGVTHEQLNEHLRDTGLFFSVDPGANATLGGMAATRASGTTAVRYGTMRENVLSLTVVLPDGRIIRTARRARKSSAGYDLTRLFVGSEGTLGVITEVTVRLYGIPSAISAATCSFPSVEAAVNTVIQTIQAGIPMARIELADDAAMNSIIRYSKLDLPVAPILWMEFHGTENAVAEQAKIVQRIAADHGGTHFAWASKPEERRRLWQARHDAHYAAKGHIRERRSGRPMSACRFPGWPNASPKRKRTSSLPFCRQASPGMQETATFTSASCSTRTTRGRWRRPNGSTNGSSIARCHSTAPAPASTASVTARSTS
jgi:D-lactate dehydrogenase (cytochrome)